MKQSQIEDLDPNFKKTPPKRDSIGMTFGYLALKARDGRTLSTPMPDFQQKQRGAFVSRCGN